MKKTQKRERYPRRPADAITWREDFVALIKPAGFDLGFSGTTAYGVDKHGDLWQVAVIGPKGINTMWYKYGTSLDHASESYGWMTRDTFRELFVEKEDVGH